MIPDDVPDADPYTPFDPDETMINNKSPSPRRQDRKRGFNEAIHSLKRKFHATVNLRRAEAELEKARQTLADSIRSPSSFPDHHHYAADDQDDGSEISCTSQDTYYQESLSDAAGETSHDSDLIQDFATGSAGNNATISSTSPGSPSTEGSHSSLELLTPRRYRPPLGSLTPQDSRTSLISLTPQSPRAAIPRTTIPPSTPRVLRVPQRIRNPQSYRVTGQLAPSPAISTGISTENSPPEPFTGISEDTTSLDTALGAKPMHGALERPVS